MGPRRRGGGGHGSDTRSAVGPSAAVAGQGEHGLDGQVYAVVQSGLAA